MKLNLERDDISVVSNHGRVSLCDGLVEMSLETLLPG